MQGRHDNHRRSKVPAANEPRPIASGRLCSSKVSKLFRAGEWICRRSNRWRDSPHRLLLSRWPLPQRNPLELLCEGIMRQPQICDHCGGRFGMVTHRWWGNSSARGRAKTHTSVNLCSTEIKSVAGTASSAGNGFKLLCPARLKSPCETSATKLSSPSAKAAPESQTVRHQAALEHSIHSPVSPVFANRCESHPDVLCEQA